MTTACGSTTSSQDTQSTPKALKPVEEAPLRIYLEILREQGYGDDADISETFYVETLKQFGYNEETIYNTPFQNLVKAVELILDETKKELSTVAPTVTPPVTPMPASTNMLLGEAADKLTEKQLQYLIMRQMMLYEEERTRQTLNR